MTVSVDAKFAVDSGRQPVVWPIGRGHLLVVGTTGAGKSSVPRAVGVAVAQDPLVQAVGIDLKAVELAFLEPRLSAFAVDPPDVVAVLDMLVDILRARRRIAQRRRWRTWQATPRHPFIFVAIDEMAEVTRHDRAVEDLDVIARLGRALGFALLACTQRAEASALGGATARLMYSQRFCMASLDEASYELGLAVDVRALRPLIARLSVSTPGLGLLVEPGRDVRRARAVWWPDDAVDRAVAAGAHLTVELEDLAERAAQDAARRPDPVVEVEVVKPPTAAQSAPAGFVEAFGVSHPS